MKDNILTLLMASLLSLSSSDRGGLAVVSGSSIINNYSDLRSTNE